MKILIIGSGGREHAMAWKAAQNPQVSKIYLAPGNGLTAIEGKCENINLCSNDDLLDFAQSEKIDLTIVGPEVPLMDGIVDKFQEKGLKIFGPDKKAAMLEGSKAFAKAFMKKHNVITAEYEEFNDFSQAAEYIKQCKYPLVIKADGLAAGKGVVICENEGEASSTLKDFMINDIFKGSGKKVIIEEFLQGVEASILSITDGNTIIPFVSAKDHKQIFDGSKGPNTGGMGALAPNPYCTEKVLEEFRQNILEPTLKGLKAENLDFCGIIFFGLMITEKGVYLLEYNIRLGDPETQAVLPLMESDFVELINCALNKNLNDYKIKWQDRTSICVVAASKGYPGSFEKGFEITGITEDKTVFGAGVKLEKGRLLTNGGRVLCTQAFGDNAESARENAYRALKQINFNNIYYRNDIGKIW